MPTFPNFEEKQFEGALNADLLASGRLIYPPGQVLEAAVGFDAAIYSNNPKFWALWGHTGIPTGLPIGHRWWPVLPSPLPSFPPFALNVFIQYKRPQYIGRRGWKAKEWKHWRQDYYRFAITPHQQTALEHCENSLGAMGIVAYSSPVFHQATDLYRHQAAGTLIDNSNFAKVSSLTGHGMYTYVSPGTSGIACSEPREIPHFDLLAEVRSALERSERSLSPREFIGQTYDRLRGLWPIDVLNLEEYLGQALEGLEVITAGDAEPAEIRRVVRQFTAVQAISRHFGATWLVAARQAETPSQR